MHKPSGILSSLSIERMAGKPYNAIAAFQSQLQSGPIGFHVYHLFAIDTSTIMMICGTVLTYAVITIQLKPTAIIDPGSTFATNDVITNVTSPNVLQSALP
ncbi:hypothetical protein V1264_015213 [Littorina saxatilis]|uniref:Uncharacterized protein n=1 Tax=Littorina saxatilis TaxID=31220 RepID=A0AAN9BL95_9CAEN